MPTGKSSVMYMNPMYLKEKKKGKMDEPIASQRVIPTKLAEVNEKVM